MTANALRFYVANIAVPLLFALAVFAVFDLTTIDVWISKWLYDPASHTFLMQNDRLFENITHRWARIVPNWTGEAALIGMLLSFIAPLLTRIDHQRLNTLLHSTRLARLLTFCREHRRDFIYVVVSFALTTMFIHYFKSHTNVYCPIETTLYGGAHPKTDWFSNFQLIHEAGKGRCWPGGHASGGFTLLALYFVALRYRWRHAKALLVCTLLLGMVYGSTRVLQGWHFMSHTFWAGIIVWFCALLTALLFYGRAGLQSSAITDADRQTISAPPAMRATGSPTSSARPER
jgi:membrane-associated PAP2 superfamily phosphatase